MTGVLEVCCRLAGDVSGEWIESSDCRCEGVAAVLFSDTLFTFADPLECEQLFEVI